MSRDELERFFAATLEGAPRDLTDIETAVGAGRRRRRRRRALVVCSAVGVVVVVAGVLVGPVGLRRGSDTPGPGGTGPAGGMSGQARPSSTASVVMPAPTPTAMGAVVTRPDQIEGAWWATWMGGFDVRAARHRGNPVVVWFGVRGPGEQWWSADDGCNQMSGTFRLVGSRLELAGGVMTQVGCDQAFPHEQSPDTVLTADQARVVAADGGTPATLTLLAAGTVVAQYAAVPDADAARPAGAVLTSAPAPTDGSGSGMAALVSGPLGLGPDGCLRLGTATTVFPAGTSWSGSLGLLVLPDGSTARPGDTISGGGGALPSAVGRAAVTDAVVASACQFTEEVWVFNRGEPLAVTPLVRAAAPE